MHPSTHVPFIYPHHTYAHLAINISLYPTICPCGHPSIHPLTHLSTPQPSPYLLIYHLSTHPSSLHLFIHPFNPSAHPHHHWSTHPSTHPHTHPPTHLWPTHLPIYPPSIHTSPILLSTRLLFYPTVCLCTLFLICSPSTHPQPIHLITYHVCSCPSHLLTHIWHIMSYVS